MNFEHSDFDIVSDFDIRIFINVIGIWGHVKLPKSNTELLRHHTRHLEEVDAEYIEVLV